MYKTPKEFRPNTKKIFETFWDMKLPEGYSVHHILPLRLGGSHAISNLRAVTHGQHIEAHLELYRIYGDVRDLCAAYMLRGLPQEARKLAAAKGGRAGQAAMRERGQLNGFGAQPPSRRKEVAAAAGRLGAAAQMRCKIGIHGQSKEEHARIASLGGHASCNINGWRTSATQSENGKRGGPKNKGFLWYTDGVNVYKYTKREQEIQPFEKFTKLKGFRAGRLKISTRWYNDGTANYPYTAAQQNRCTLEEFVCKHGYFTGRLPGAIGS